MINANAWYQIILKSHSSTQSGIIIIIRIIFIIIGDGVKSCTVPVEQVLYVIFLRKNILF